LASVGRLPGLALFTLKLRLGARADQCVLKLARTIADLEGSECIANTNLAEAIRHNSGWLVSGSTFQNKALAIPIRRDLARRDYMQIAPTFEIAQVTGI